MSEGESETVYTVNVFYDGPRFGIADYGGRPHLYESRWVPSRQRWEGESDYVFWLSPVSQELFKAALEDWAIWERWEAAFHDGQADESTHPALPEDRARHEHLQVMLREGMRPDQPGAFPVIGDFVRDTVRWRPAPAHLYAEPTISLVAEELWDT